MIKTFFLNVEKSSLFNIEKQEISCFIFPLLASIHSIQIFLFINNCGTKILKNLP